MAIFNHGSPSKLTLELDGFIYEAIDPSVTLTSSFDCVTIEARCWNMTTTQKENVEDSILDNLEQEVKKDKKKVKARKDRFPKDGGRPIKASVPGYSKIPWSKGTLTLIAQSPNGQLHYAKTMGEKKQFAWGNFNWIAVCWPGQYTQDIFLIDDMDAFRRALGFKPVEETVQPVVVDEKGVEWIIEQLFTPKTDKVAAPRQTFSYDYKGF